MKVRQFRKISNHPSKVLFRSSSIRGSSWVSSVIRSTMHESECSRNSIRCFSVPDNLSSSKTIKIFYINVANQSLATCQLCQLCQFCQFERQQNPLSKSTFVENIILWVLHYFQSVSKGFHPGNPYLSGHQSSSALNVARDESKCSLSKGNWVAHILNI